MQGGAAFFDAKQIDLRPEVSLSKREENPKDRVSALFTLFPKATQPHARLLLVLLNFARLDLLPFQGYLPHSFQGFFLENRQTPGGNGGLSKRTMVD